MEASQSQPPAQLALDHCSDDDLVRLTRGGMLRAFDILVKRHQALAARIAARYVGQSALARDVTQQAFLEVFRTLPRYEPRDKFKPFLKAIVINQCRMLARSYRSAARRNDQLFFQRDVSANHVMRCVQRRDLQSALSQLSEKLQVVVVLRYKEDLSLAEISEALNIPIGTVKRRLFDAMGQLRNYLE